MTTFAATTFLRDSLFYIIALVLCILVVVPESHFPQMLFDTNGTQLLLLGAIVLCTSCAVQVLQRIAGEFLSSRVVGTGLSVIIAINLLLVLQATMGMFSGMEKTAAILICLFGLFKMAWLLIATYWRLIPGMVSRVVLVGNGDLVQEMRSLISASNGRFVLSDVIECAPMLDAAGRSLRVGTRDIFQKAREVRADKVVVSLAERRGAFPLQDMLDCKLSGIEVLDAQQFYELVNRKLMLEKITPSWFIFANGFRINGVRRFVKRILDIVLALFGLIVTAPFLPFVALAIKMESPGDVFFRQVRTGLADQDFVIFKFRTMRQDAEKDSGAVWAQENDSRITGLGNILRKTRIDEIPQLFNVLLGDMSIVGPRPERPEFIRTLKEKVPYYSERHFVKPGITGWAQVSYPYGSSVADALEKLRYDLYYIKNYSLLFDFVIMFKTIGVVINKMGR